MAVAVANRTRPRRVTTCTISIRQMQAGRSAHRDEKIPSSCSELPPEGLPVWVGSRALQGVADPPVGVLGVETYCAGRWLSGTRGRCRKSNSKLYSSLNIVSRWPHKSENAEGPCRAERMLPTRRPARRPSCRCCCRRLLCWSHHLCQPPPLQPHRLLSSLPLVL